MKLTDEEKRILDGEQGWVPQRCMEYLVETGEAANAERLVDLDGTADFHTPMTAMIPHWEFPIEELKKLVDSGAKFKVPTFANKSPFYEFTFMDGWQHCGFPPHDDPLFHEKSMHREFLELYEKMGLLTAHSCDYYLAATYWPTAGQHCAWNESSAIPYCNAVLGARTNIDGSFMTAFLGKAPYYGMHITENRYATVVVDTERKIRTDLEWDVFGFTMGEECGLSVPALINTAKPTTTQLLKLNSALNTGGGVTMYHIPGTTPEAPTVEYALGGRTPEKEILIDDKRLRMAYDTLNYYKQDRVDMVSFGCPHYGMVELMMLARKLEGKKVKVPVWIMTIPWLYPVAERQGLKKVFDDAGALLVSGTCPSAIRGLPGGLHSLAVDSAKQAYYISGLYPEADNSLDVFYGTQDECIEAALTGKWSGEWR